MGHNYEGGGDEGIVYVINNFRNYVIRYVGRDMYLQIDYSRDQLPPYLVTYLLK